MRALLLFLGLAASWSQAAAAQEPADVTVRIKSHGASGVVIASVPGRSWILGCAHMLQGTAKEFTIDGPPQPWAPQRPVQARLLAADHRLDLSLLELDNGPFLFIPVAPLGYTPKAQVVSAGFDGMRWPLTQRATWIVGLDGAKTWTRDPPTHGRSGGGLFDGRWLIGVVQGFEVGGANKGVYASHAAVVSFLASVKPDLLRR